MKKNHKIFIRLKYDYLNFSYTHEVLIFLIHLKLLIIILTIYRLIQIKCV